MIRHVRFVIIVFAAVSLFATLGSIMAIREANVLSKGISEGFRIDGTYRDHDTGLASLSFLGDDEMRWQFVDSAGSVVEGTFAATDDPNLFELSTQSGNAYGLVHLAYVSDDGNNGTLYLKTEAGVIEFDKMERVPGFIVP